MLPVEFYISELLYDYDCVMVPEFGGFVASATKASIHPILHSFQPPSKRIAFNIFLKDNDGLLANHIARKNNIDYHQALIHISQFVKNLESDLALGKKIGLAKIGALYMDAEQNLQFIPVTDSNYLASSFGLQPLHFSPINRSDFQHKVSHQLSELKNRDSIKPAKPIIGRKWGKLTYVMMGAAMAWLGFNIYLITPTSRDQQSALLSFDTAVKPAMVTPPPVQQPTVHKAETIFVPSTPVKEPRVLENKQEKIAARQTDLTMPPTVAYHLIAGAFKVEENALKLMLELKANGYTSACTLRNNKGLTMVSYGYHTERAAAEKRKSDLATSRIDTWILKQNQ
ncbi:MAG: hypothetical protein RIQ89_1826 [Bacteroidota bacterium]